MKSAFVIAKDPYLRIHPKHIRRPEAVDYALFEAEAPEGIRLHAGVGLVVGRPVKATLDNLEDGAPIGGVERIH
jgi:hypothetical protein